MPCHQFNNKTKRLEYFQSLLFFINALLSSYGMPIYIQQEQITFFVKMSMIHNGLALYHFSECKLKTPIQGLNSLSYFKLMKKWSAQGDCTFTVSWAHAKKTRWGLNSLSNFRAHKKTVHSRTLIRFRIFMLMKK